MNAKRTLTYLGIAIAGAVALEAPANAFSFNSGTALGDCSAVPLESLGANGTSVSTVSSCTTADGITVSAGSDKLTLKEVNGVKGVGVFGDTHPNGSIQELDYGESITLSTESASIFSSLDISFLYQAGEFGDKINEVAKITADGVTGSLSVLDGNTARWSWGDIVRDISGNATQSGGGLFSILNPFGETTVSTVTLTSFAEAGDSYQYSDYGLAGAEILSPTSTDVPEPSLLVGGLVAVAGAFGLRRRSDDR